MKITNKLNLPQSFVDIATREYTYKDKQYSVTSILGGIRETILKRRHYSELEQDISEMIWLIFGSAVHSILEKSNELDCEFKEEHVVIDIGDYKLSGIFDLYNGKTHTVTDYKTASVWKVIHGDWKDYRTQLLIYAYMLGKIGFKCNKGEIIALLKDHSKSKAKFDESYPKVPVHKVTFHFTKEDFEKIEIELLDKFKEIKRCEQLSDNELPICAAKERWNTGDKFAVMKKGKKRALRVLDSEEEAQEYMETKGGDYIDVRKGEDKKCNEYCSVKEFCSYYNRGQGLEEELRNFDYRGDKE